MRWWSGNVAAAAGTLACALALAACGSSGTAQTSSATSASSGAAGSGSCKTGAAASGTAATIPQEADSGVNTPAGACWNSIAPTSWSNAVIGSDVAGTSTVWKAAWSPNDLYVWSKVVLGRQAICTSPSSSWNDDSLEVYVSVPDDTSGAYPNGTGQYVVNACGENNNNGAGTPLGTDHTTVNISTKSSELETATSTGYTGLLILAWSDLGVTPKAGLVVGFTIGADFADPTNPGNRLTQTMWQGTNNNHADDSTWGTVTLG